MSDSADPRIALMQKWSQENPELLAQAGLASGFDHGTSLGAFSILKDHTDKTNKEIMKQKSDELYSTMLSKHRAHKNHSKNTTVTMTKTEMNAIVKAANEGIIAPKDTSKHTTHTKKEKKHVKYYNLTPEVLSENTERARAELAKTVSNAKTIKMIINTYFKESDLLDDTRRILDLYDRYYTSNSEADFEEVYSKLFMFSNKASRVIINNTSKSTGSRFSNQDFHVYGPETRPIVQKAFIIKTIFQILFKRYVKTLPLIKKQTPEQINAAKGMNEQFKKINKPYRELYDYGRALRIKRAEATASRKFFPPVHNASLKDKFDDSSSTFSMANPYAT